MQLKQLIDLIDKAVEDLSKAKQSLIFLDNNLWSLNKLLEGNFEPSAVLTVSEKPVEKGRPLTDLLEKPTTLTDRMTNAIQLRLETIGPLSYRELLKELQAEVGLGPQKSIQSSLGYVLHTRKQFHRNTKTKKYELRRRS